MGCSLPRQYNNPNIAGAAARRVVRYPDGFSLSQRSDTHGVTTPPLGPVCSTSCLLCAGAVISVPGQKRLTGSGSANSFSSNKRHPRDMGPGEVEAFLNHLAVHRRVAASTQSQAPNAVVFLYDSVLGPPRPPLWREPAAHGRADVRRRIAGSRMRDPALQGYRPRLADRAGAQQQGTAGPGHRNSN
jgi:hypothetical protein